MDRVNIALRGLWAITIIAFIMAIWWIRNFSMAIATLLFVMMIMFALFSGYHIIVWEEARKRDIPHEKRNAYMREYMRKYRMEKTKK